MKKLIIILLAIITPMTSLAQLKVDSLGRIGINTSESLQSSFNLGCSGENGTDAMISGAGKAVLKIIGKENKNEYATNSSLKVENYSNIPTLTFGADICSVNSVSTSKSIGLYVCAVGGNGPAGIAYGIQSFLPGSGTKGAGIFATSGLPSDQDLDGRYAGYFKGNVKVTGTINGTLVSNSDGRLKENVQDLCDDGENAVLDKLDLLNPISYNYINTESAIKNASRQSGTDDFDSLELMLMRKNEMYWEEKPNQVLLKKHYGLVAQELQQVYPDLVYENDNGYLSINYTELIPIMLQSIKELNAKVERLSAPSARKVQTVGEEATDIESTIADVAGMDQNVPNPFSGKTDIAIHLPVTVKTAMLYIYDLSGKQIEQHVIEGRGDTVMTIHADKMDAGMYIYSLIADNKVVTTKRMILVR